MLIVRRIYLYLTAAISLVAVTWSVIGLARLIISEGVGEGQIIGLATLLAIIIVGLPIFLFHWLMAQRLAARSQEERESPLRQLYFYGVMAIGAAPILSNIYRLVDNALLALVGGTRLDYYPYNLSTAEHLAAIVAWGVVWVYLWRYVRVEVDRRKNTVLDMNLTIRRLYLLGFSLAGLAMVAWGVFGLLQTLFQFATIVFWQNPIADFSAQLLVGMAGWVGHWRLLQRDFAGGDPAEERSVLRKVYLYLAVFVFSIMALSSGAALLKRFIELALGAPPSQEPLLSQLSGVLPLLIVGVVFWAYHWQVVRQDASRAPEAPRQASVRRVYAYLVATVGLATLLSGLGGLLTLLIDLLTSTFAAGFGSYREQVAWLTAMILVGLPVWWLPWRAVQRLAMVPAASTVEAETSAGEERRSTARKIYLYFYVFLASMAIFGSVGWFVFHILTFLLGADLPDDFVTQVLQALVISLLAVGVWLYHWGAIRRDGQLGEKTQSQRLADILVVVIDGDEGKLGQSIIRHLQQDLPGIQLRPVGMTPKAVETMAGQPFSAGLLEMAQYIIGSWQALSAREVAPALAANPALKLVVPLVEPNWVWAGVKRQSMEYYARQIVQGLKQAIEGEEISFERGFDAGTVVAVALGIAVLLCIGGSLIGLVDGIF
jgi:hypothetical protein